jgi:DNA-binding beta-propeller fold protein YncE
LVELDALTFEVARRFGLALGQEGPVDAPASHTGHEGHEMPRPTCSPTWAQPSADGARIYVACNRADVIVEIDRSRWAITRRFPTGRGPYNLAVTPDGSLLVATLKQGGGVQVFDLASGQSVLEARSSTTVTHGVAISPDSRYAFVSSEGVGAAPGMVDVWDLAARVRVGSVAVGQQAGGIAFWRMAPAP